MSAAIEVPKSLPSPPPEIEEVINCPGARSESSGELFEKNDTLSAMVPPDPSSVEDGRSYEIAGQVSYGRLLTGIIGVQGLVPPG
jgi:hypothetical protein